MPIELNKDYEVAKDEEIVEIAKKENITITGDYRNEGRVAEFYSNTVTVNGRVYDKDAPEDAEVKYAMQEETTKIPGLACPDCGSQAFKTDQTKVAVCGNYPGWYFFYRRLDQDLNASTKLVIKNGELVESTETGKEEASF